MKVNGFQNNTKKKKIIKNKKLNLFSSVIQKEKKTYSFVTSNYDITFIVW